MTMPMPTPVPTDTSAKWDFPLPSPWACSPRAARLMSFSIARSVFQRGAQPVEQAGAAPAGQVRGEVQPSRLRVVDAGAADHRVGDGGPFEAGLGHRRAGEVPNPGDQVVLAARVVAAVAAAHEAAPEVGHRHPDPVAADVDARDVDRARVHVVERGHGAGAAGDLADQVDQPVRLQAGQRGRDGRLGQAGGLGQIGPGGRAVVEELVEEPPLVHHPQQPWIAELASHSALLILRSWK